MPGMPGLPGVPGVPGCRGWKGRIIHHIIHCNRIRHSILIIDHLKDQNENWTKVGLFLVFPRSTAIFRHIGNQRNRVFTAGTMSLGFKAIGTRALYPSFLVNNYNIPKRQAVSKKQQHSSPSIQRFSTFVSSFAQISPIAITIKTTKRFKINTPLRRWGDIPSFLRKDCNLDCTSKAFLFPLAWPWKKNMNISTL